MDDRFRIWMHDGGEWLGSTRPGYIPDGGLFVKKIPSSLPKKGLQVYEYRSSLDCKYPASVISARPHYLAGHVAVDFGC